MNPARRILAVLLCAALLTGVLCACGKTTDAGTDTDTNDDSVAQQLYDAPVAAPDLTNAATITLSGTDDVTVTDGGVYVLTGTLTDGRVLVNAPGADVTLVLQDADITCSDSSALYIYKAASVLLYLPDGTASTLTDGSSYNYSDSVSSAIDEEPNACLYAKSDLIITGGTVIAAGYSGMTQNFGTDSTQGSILLTSRSTSTETIRVTDASGSVLAEFTPAKAYNCVIVSTPALKQGGTYTVTMGGESTDVTLDSLIYGSGGMGGGMGGQPGGNMGTPPDRNGGSMGTPPGGNNGKGGRPGQ